MWRIFAGLRSDPFFLDVIAFRETVQTRRLAFKEVGDNHLAGKNARSLVLEIDAAEVLGSASMFAVVAETLTVGEPPVRLERVGRPEIKNGTLRVKEFDTVNPDLEIRDLYNDEDAFDLRAEHLGAYRARFNANLAFFDGLDATVDGPLAGGWQSPTHRALAARLPGRRRLEAVYRRYLFGDRARHAHRPNAGDLWWAVAQRQLHGQLLHDADQRRKRCTHQRRPHSRPDGPGLSPIRSRILCYRVPHRRRRANPNRKDVTAAETDLNSMTFRARCYVAGLLRTPIGLRRR